MKQYKNDNILGAVAEADNVESSVLMTANSMHWVAANVHDDVLVSVCRRHIQVGLISATCTLKYLSVTVMS